MPRIHPIPAIQYAAPPGADVSDRIAPPYDVLDETSKGALVAASADNIVTVDLPHMPAKTLGPDVTYERAGDTWRRWLADGVVVQRDEPALFVYQQTFTVAGTTHRRRGLIANVALQPFGPAPDGHGGVHPHEQTFDAAKQDRLMLMRATGAQLSPIFGLYDDPADQVAPMLAGVIDIDPPDRFGVTADGTRHDLWTVRDARPFLDAMLDMDVFIADGHHRYNTALMYQQQAPAADICLFVLVAMQDPGMIVLPTHRVLGGLEGLTIDALAAAAQGVLNITRVDSDDLTQLETALPNAGHHAMGLFLPRDDHPLAIATTAGPDPLAASHPDQSPAWRQLDVAILQHLTVNQLLAPMCPRDGKPTWKYPHTLDQLRTDAADDGFQLGVIMQATPLKSVLAISRAGELMPQKSTYFFPKLATGLVINPISQQKDPESKP